MNVVELLTAGMSMLTVLVCTGGALYMWLSPEAHVERYVSGLRSRQPELDANALELERIKKRRQLFWVPLLLVITALLAGLNAILNLLMAFGI